MSATRALACLQAHMRPRWGSAAIADLYAAQLLRAARATRTPHALEAPLDGARVTITPYRVLWLLPRFSVTITPARAR